jgi:hypothetical protein
VDKVNIAIEEEVSGDLVSVDSREKMCNGPDKGNVYSLEGILESIAITGEGANGDKLT